MLTCAAQLPEDLFDHAFVPFTKDACCAARADREAGDVLIYFQLLHGMYLSLHLKLLTQLS